MAMEFDDEPEPPPKSFLKRYRVAIIVTGIVLAGIIAVAKLASSGGSSRRDSITLVSLAPPPPPPPPVMTPPPPPQQEEQKMDQPMIKEDQPKEAPPKDEPPLGTGIKGDGPDSFGLSDKAGNGRMAAIMEMEASGVGTANQVQTKIEEALRRNRKTRSASLSVSVRVWPDATGRINRAQIAGSTGDPALDTALRDEVLTGLQLQEPPPAGMPAPIVLQLRAASPTTQLFILCFSLNHALLRLNSHRRIFRRCQLCRCFAADPPFSPVDKVARGANFQNANRLRKLIDLRKHQLKAATSSPRINLAFRPLRPPVRPRPSRRHRRMSRSISFIGWCSAAC